VTSKSYTSQGLIGRILMFAMLLIVPWLESRSQVGRNSQEVWPSIDGYYRINPKFRLYGTVGSTKPNDSSYTDGAVGIFLDHFTYPLTRILRPDHAEDLPGKFLWLRVGYQYSATPPSAKDPFKESMIVTEINARYYLPYKMLLTWRNRFDWRVNNGYFKARYRPKLNIEKDLRTEFLFFTASAFAEYFINFDNSAVNKLRTQVGIEFKLTKHINYEAFWNHQYANEPEIQTNDAFGMTLKIYLDRKEMKEKSEKKKNMKNMEKQKSNPLPTTGQSEDK
jgi:hypothetical protein